jgi:hypothetical protein
MPSATHTSKLPARLPLREACRLLGCGKTTYAKKWQHVFTEYRLGNHIRVSEDELAAALRHQRYEESVAAVEEVRARAGRLPELAGRSSKRK